MIHRRRIPICPGPAGRTRPRLQTRRTTTHGPGANLRTPLTELRQMSLYLSKHGLQPRGGLGKKSALLVRSVGPLLLCGFAELFEES